MRGEGVVRCGEVCVSCPARRDWDPGGDGVWHVGSVAQVDLLCSKMIKKV